MTKIRRVDLWPDDALTGTLMLSDTEMGVYVRIWLLIYSTGGPIQIDHLKSVCHSHGNAFNHTLKRLETLGKIQRNGREIDQKRCRNELEKASNRQRKASENARDRWKNKDIDDADALLTSNAIARVLPSPTPTTSFISPNGESHRNAFDRWWEGYPEKVGKGAAKKSFTKALTKTSLDQLMVGLDRYKATKPVDRPWCNPATWLNQERWLDVPASNGHAPDSNVLPFGGPPTGPPPIPEGGFFPVDGTDSE